MKQTFKVWAVMMLISVAPIGTLYAQWERFYLSGKVKDISSRMYISDATVEVMTTDSVVLAEKKSLSADNLAMNNNRMVNLSISLKELQHDRLILRFTHPGYTTKYMDIHIQGKRNNYRYLGDVLLLRRDNILLDEVTVEATKIRMVAGKDTLVFNASEFQLAQGSMLDGLIRQLPGVQLDGGRIMVNGRFVSSLLVNGEDFFRGDPRVALENLPAYMVNKVKVYERTPEYAYITGVDSLKEYPLVMDVNLKREYSVGWIANAEAAYGTNDRYLGRVFGLRFSDVSRLALFGNFNNTNDTRSPGSSGNWNPSWQASGLTDMQYGGAELLLKDLDDKWKLTSNVKLTHEDIVNESVGSGDYFITSDNAYWRNKSNGRTDRFKVSSDHDLQLKYDNWYGNVTPRIEYTDGSNRVEQLYASFSANPMDSYRGAAIDSLFAGMGSQRLEESLVNRVTNVGEGWNRNLSARVNANAMIRIPNTPDYVNVAVNGKFNRTGGEQFAHYDLRYGNSMEGNDVYQNRYATMPSLNYEYGASASYRYKGKSLHVTPGYSYRKHHSSGNYKLYRLDRFAEWSGGSHALGTLPSTRDSLQQCLDYQNSYNSVANSDIHKIEVNITQFFRLFGKQRNIGFTPTLRMQTDRLDYARGSLDTTMKRQTIVFEPYVRFGFDDFNLSYRMDYNEPSLVRLLDVVDDNNPLIVRYGNPTLKQTRRHSVDFSRYWSKREISRSMRVTARYNLIENAVAEAMTYDPQTGIRTYRPENINGNWDAGAAFHFTQALDEKQRLFITTNTDASFVNSVDYLSLTGATVSTRSEVRNLSLSENLSLSYKWKNHSVGFRGDARWTHATSPRTDFTTINVADFNYGLNAQLILPWNCSLSTDLTMYSRRGYEDRAMNTNDLVWNARLANASLLHGNLIFMLDGFDILGQLSTVRRTLNAQGRTETWYNAVPRYAMLHVVYRLNREPKKK